MFGRQGIEAAFRASCHVALDGLPAQEGFDHIFEFFEGVPSSEALPENEDGDMLLFQWGNPWRCEDIFYVSLTRQLIFPDGEDQDIRQLSLQYDFAAANLPKVESGNIWCHRRAGLPEFRTHVAQSDAMRAVAGHVATATLDVSSV